MSRFRLGVAVCVLWSAVCSLHAQEPALPVPAPPDEVRTGVTVDVDAAVETVEEKYPDGRTRIRRDVTLDTAGNYINHGAWTWLAEDGTEIASGRYRANRRDGEWTRKFDWGQAELFNEPPYSSFKAPFVSTAEFVGGRLHGEWIIRDAEGRLVSQWTYADGRRHGTCSWYFPGGNPQRRIEFRNGLMHGARHEWTEDETLVVDERYEDGCRLALRQKLYDDGAVMWQCMFRHERNEPVAADDWWNAKPAAWKPVGRPARHGKLTSWYPTGQKQSEGTYREDKRDGTFTWWHQNTQKAVEGPFRDDQPHGTFTWWHENGLKSVSGQYANGRPTGLWRFWADSGKLERQMNLDTESVRSPGTAEANQADDAGVVAQP